MRPPSKRQSALRNPLNALLGTPANVRVLRALAESDTALSASEMPDDRQLASSIARYVRETPVFREQMPQRQLPELHATDPRQPQQMPQPHIDDTRRGRELER